MIIMSMSNEYLFFGNNCVDDYNYRLILTVSDYIDLRYFIFARIV